MANKNPKENKKNNKKKKEEILFTGKSALNNINNINFNLNNNPNNENDFIFKEDDSNLNDKSAQMDFEDEIKEKEKPYKEFHSLIEDLNVSNEKNSNLNLNLENEKVNNSMFEKPKLNLKKPPVPNFDNLYKKADKNFLKKIQNVIKKSNSNKSFNYISSDEEN